MESFISVLNVLFSAAVFIGGLCTLFFVNGVDGAILMCLAILVYSTHSIHKAIEVLIKFNKED